MGTHRLIRVTARLPLGTAHALGAALGGLVARSGSRLRRAAERNIAQCLPEWPAAERQRLFLDTMAECGRAAAEIGYLCLRPENEVLAKVREVSGLDGVIALRGEHRGLLVAAPHLGAWELAGLYGARHLAPVTVMHRPPKQPGLARLVAQSRGRGGARVVSADGSGLRVLYRTLRAGGTVGLLPDQDPGRAGVFAPFFGVSASTTTLVQRLLRGTGAAFALAYAERLPRGTGYRLQVVAGPEAAAHDDPVVAATALNAAIEDCARRVPAQYQWCYKRFKTRPPGEADFYR